MESSVEDQGEAVLEGIARMWWLWLVYGLVWTIVGLTILQFDEASVNTIGIIVGLMFIATGLQQFTIGRLVDRGSWLFYLFGALFTVAGVVALMSPGDTFNALADVLGFLFLIVGAFWIIQALGTKDVNELWWLGLLAGILMVILAFWTVGPVLHREGLRAARLLRHLGADAGRDRHRPRLPDPQAGADGLRRTGQGPDFAVLTASD